eukprot:SAG31_NODE_26455_length_442_cov_0.606414_1_plen_52_part_10
MRVPYAHGLVEYFRDGVVTSRLVGHVNRLGETILRFQTAARQSTKARTTVRA